MDPYSDAHEIVDRLFEIGGTNYGNDDQPFFFRNRMIGCNLNLITATHNLRKSSRNTLNGFEFLDIIRESDRGACMERAKVHRRRINWADLVHLVDSVLACSNFGDAITPTRTGSRPCSRCNSLPKGFRLSGNNRLLLETIIKTGRRDCRRGSSCISVLGRVLWNIKRDHFKIVVARMGALPRAGREAISSKN